MNSRQEVILRPWTDADVEPLMRVRNDVELQKTLMARPQPNNEQQVREWLHRKSDAADGEFLVIADADSNRTLGFVQAEAIDPRNLSGRLGICIVADAQGRGLGPSALEIFECHLQKKHHLRKLTLSVLASNARAIAVYNQLGYRTAGRWTDHHYLDGKYLDVVLMEKHLSS